MYFPTEIFKYIIEYNGINDYFPKKIINLFRYASIDDLTIVLKDVLNITYKFNHKQLSTERRRILLKILFTQNHEKHIFIKLINHYEMMNNIYSYHNYGFKVGDEVIWFKSINLKYCGIITKINNKSIKLKCYDYEIRTAENWNGKIVNFKYWLKDTFNKHIFINDKIENVYKNDYGDIHINREHFTRIRIYN